MKDAVLTILGIIEYHLKYKKFLQRSEKDINKFQFKKLKNLLIDCNEVPYYRTLFQSIKFNPKRDFNQLSDLKLLPILKKEIARSNHDLLLNSKRSKNALIFKTSGTTGTPFTAYISPKHWIVEQAVIWRHWKWAGYKLFDPMAILRSHNPKNDSEIIKTDKIRHWTYYSPYHLNDKYMEIFYRDIFNKGTKFLRGYPSSLSLFADFCIQKGYKISSLKACLTASEVLTEQERETIEKAFEVRVYDHYGLAETIVMLHNDGSRNGYINCDEYGYLELIPTESPNYYKIIGTNLNNQAMPLIRYDTEDIAEVITDSNGKLKIKNILGRKDLYIQTEITNIPTVNLYTTLYKVEGIIQWQIIQNDNKSLDIYLKISSKNNFEKITQEVDKLNNTGLLFKYHRTNIFSLTGEGKLKPFISNLQ
jgi:phenylacetate-CoA ligase